jgi:hypothetical protein
MQTVQHMTLNEGATRLLSYGQWVRQAAANGRVRQLEEVEA